MNMLRRFGLSVAVLLFSFCISVGALFVGLYAVFETPQSLKQALDKSGIYNISAQDSLASEEATASSLPVNDPGLQQAFSSSFSSSFVRQSSEKVIDNIYNWGQGRTASPDFSVDLNQPKNTFADNVAVYVKQRLDNLPLCTQIITPPTSLDELLSMTCRPYGISTAAIAETARQEVLNTKLFSDNNTIDTSTFKDAEGRPMSEQLSFIPVVHQYYLVSLYILPFIILLCIVAIIFWSITKRAGVKRIAWILISIGFANAIFAIVQVWFLHAGAAVFGTPASASPAVYDKLLLVLETLATELRNWWLGFGVGFMVIGIMVLIILAFIRPKKPLMMGSGNKYSDTTTANTTTL